MNDNKRKSLIEFGQTALIFVLAGVAIISGAGVWNAVALKAIPSFYGWVAGANFVAEGFGIYKLAKKFFTKENKEVEKDANTTKAKTKTTKTKKN